MPAAPSCDILASLRASGAVMRHFEAPACMPHKSLSTTGKTERAEKQRTEKKSRQTLSTFCLDFGWIQGGGIEGLQRAGWIEASQRAKNARKGA